MCRFFPFSWKWRLGGSTLEPMSKELEIPVQPKVDSFHQETLVWKQGLTQCLI